MKFGVYIFLEGPGGALAYVGQTARTGVASSFLDREAEHRLSQRMFGQFRAMFQVDNVDDLRDLEQIVLNQVRARLGLAENQLRSGALMDGRGIGNIINPRNACVRDELRGLGYCR